MTDYLTCNSYNMYLFIMYYSGCLPSDSIVDRDNSHDNVLYENKKTAGKASILTEGINVFLFCNLCIVMSCNTN